MKLRPAMRKLFSKESHQKAQSAMEYLMTYGWAILIIAVVLGALFQLGVFNANNFAPKAPPGACRVFRPNGPYTTSFINLEGVCSGELPQYVMYATSSGSGQIFSLSGTISGATSTVWVQYTGIDNGCPHPLGAGYNANNPVGTGWFYIDGGCNSQNPYLDYSGPSSPEQDIGFPTASTGSWYFLAATYSPTALTIYLNGQQVGPVLTPNTLFMTVQYIYTPGYWSGNSIYMANAQLYNTSLSANEIQALYLEGIGGAPIDLQNLVGWWPLNGNANDYSGNGYNGQATGVTYTSSWTSGYTPP
jgi:hypothetical protein